MWLRNIRTVIRLRISRESKPRHPYFCMQFNGNEPFPIEAMQFG